MLKGLQHLDHRQAGVFGELDVRFHLERRRPPLKNLGGDVGGDLFGSTLGEKKERNDNQ